MKRKLKTPTPTKVIDWLKNRSNRSNTIWKEYSKILNNGVVNMPLSVEVWFKETPVTDIVQTVRSAVNKQAGNSALYGIPECAEITGKSENYIRRKMISGNIPFQVRNSLAFFKHSEVIAWLNKSKPTTSEGEIIERWNSESIVKTEK